MGWLCLYGWSDELSEKKTGVEASCTVTHEYQQSFQLGNRSRLDLLDTLNINLLKTMREQLSYTTSQIQ
ncbi:MAG: hypothetical protein KAG53_06890 [Endozoicomonadaceae bacterium]|nr:hypothetical protein [Endozoicomonadaceae bacterium]